MSHPLQATVDGASTAGSGTHTHDWQLSSVEFEDGVEVSRYDCGGCAEVTFR